MDTFSKAVRSQIMSKVLAENTKPEILVRKYLFAAGFRYRKNVKALCGKPDLVFPKYKTLVFIHGCFWHGHPDCDAAKLPKSNIEYWKHKIKKNAERDNVNVDALREQGWQVLIVWECELRNKTLKERRLSRLKKQILKGIKSDKRTKR